MSTAAVGLPRSPSFLRKSFRRRIVGWAGIEDRPPIVQESLWLSPPSADDRSRQTSADGDGASSCDADSIGSTHDNGEQRKIGKPTRSRKRDWFKILLAARNLATCVYAVSYTTTLPVLPFMANRLIHPRESTGPDDPGSEGVREAWRGMAYGLVMSGYYLTKMISAPWIGFLSDRVGRRQALVVTLLGGALSFFVTRLWGQYSIHGLILCRLLMGCFAANGALMHAYIRDTVPQEWQSSAFSQHSAAWGCAYLAAPALISWFGDSADAILAVATATMIISAMIVEVTFVDTRPEGMRTPRMSGVIGEYLKEGARDLAEVGKKVSGVDLAEYFNGGREKEPSVPSPQVSMSKSCEKGVGNGSRTLADSRSNGNGTRSLPRQNGKAYHVGGDEGGGAVNANGSRIGNGPSSSAGGVDRRTSEAKTDPPADMTGRALVGVFKGMMKERLVLVTFVLQAIRPAQDLAPLVSLKFSGGASVLAGITSSRSLCRVVVPMTPLIPWLVRLAGGYSSEGAAARRGGDRAVAAFMCVVMAGLVVAVPAVGSLRDLHHLMAFKGLCHILRESTAGAVMARAAGTSSVGAFFGWQHCIKGVQGTFSHFLTGWLSGFSIALPYYVVAICDLLYAFTYLYI